jgi:hypothetical protein
MAYLYTGTSSAAATATGLSTQVIVKVDGQSIGAIQTLNMDQRRPLRRIGEVGTDGVIEIVPNAPTEFQLRIERVHFDRKSITEAMARGFINIQSQRIPFDIYIYDFSNVPAGNLTDDFDVAGNDGMVTTIYENCWIESKSSTFQSNDYIRMENVSVWAEFCHTFMNGNPTQNASVGAPSIEDAVERTADVGRRGSLDARGLARLGKVFDDLLNQ